MARCRGDRGVAVAAAPLILIMVVLTMVVVQVSLLFYGQMLVTDAAQHSLDAARVRHESDAAAIEAGQRTGRQFLSQMHGLDGTPVVSVGLDEGQVSVSVTAEPVEVLPGFPLPSLSVERTASRERVLE